MTDDLELGDLGAVKREGTLNTDTEGNLADGEGLTGTGAGHADNVTLENLDALAVAFLNAVVNLDVVGNADLRDVLADLLTLDCADVIHVQFLTLLEVPYHLGRHVVEQTYSSIHARVSAARTIFFADKKTKPAHDNRPPHK